LPCARVPTPAYGLSCRLSRRDPDAPRKRAAAMFRPVVAGITDHAAAAGQRQGNRTLSVPARRCARKPQRVNPQTRTASARAGAGGERTHNGAIMRRWGGALSASPRASKGRRARRRAAWRCLAAAVTSPSTPAPPTTATVGRSFAAATSERSDLRAERAPERLARRMPRMRRDIPRRRLMT